jgi:hypothetical protein
VGKIPKPIYIYNRINLNQKMMMKMKKGMVFSALFALMSFQGFAQVDTNYVGNGSANDTIRISIGEGTPTAPIKSIYVKDQDRPDTLTISLSGADAATFSINNTPGILSTTADSVAGTLESTTNFDANSQDKYVVNLTATDKGGLSFTAPMSITVLPAALDSISLDVYTFTENTTPTFTPNVYRQNGGQNNWIPLNGVTYVLNSITPNNGVSDGTEFSIVNGKIEGNLSKTFDFEAVNEWTLNVTATRKGQSVTENFVVSVDDANEIPFGIGVK